MPDFLNGFLQKNILEEYTSFVKTILDFANQFAAQQDVTEDITETTPVEDPNPLPAPVDQEQMS